MQTQNRPRRDSFSKRPFSRGPKKAHAPTKTGGFIHRYESTGTSSHKREHARTEGYVAHSEHNKQRNFKKRDTQNQSRDFGRNRGGFRGSEGRSFGGNKRSFKKRELKTFDVSQYINKNPVITSETEAFVPKHKFTEFGLDKKLAFTITSSGLTLPTPIQDGVIPHILEGRDVIGLANTGTGKTAAFLIPLIDKTLRAYGRQTLILTPTRELALQIENELKKLTAGFKIFSTTCVGGTGIRPQIYALKKKNHFIIGTPGRIMDLIERGALIPTQITTVVLDEADRMLDMGFIGDMRTILAKVPEGHETLFFSATMSDEIGRLVHDFLRDPVTISVKKQDVASSVAQDVVTYHHAHKFEVLTKLLANENMKRVLIFGAMKHSVEKLSEELIAHGISADSIHGNKSHSQRQRALKRFKDSHARVLVATDVAARGIHVDGVSHVINYDLPATYEDYIHRIGRTGRGNERGMALTFVEVRV